MDSYNLKKLHQTELEILKVFKKFCIMHSLQYFLIGGALLGSVRYGRFIPWDDDIDVGMFREDYNKLQYLWGKSPIGGFFLQSNKTDPNFARGIMKLRMDGTKLVELSSQNIHLHDGVYIDIFPIDYVDTNKGIKIALRGLCIKRLLSLRSIKSGCNNGRYPVLKKLIKHLFPLSNIYIDKMIEKLSTRENSNIKKYAVIWVHNYNWRKQIHPIKVFGSGSKCIFEGFEFTAPSDKNSFLAKVFGEDYYDEPPLQNRITPHKFIRIEL